MLPKVKTIQKGIFWRSVAHSWVPSTLLSSFIGNQLRCFLVCLSCVPFCKDSRLCVFSHFPSFIQMLTNYMLFCTVILFRLLCPGKITSYQFIHVFIHGFQPVFYTWGHLFSNNASFINLVHMYFTLLKIYLQDKSPAVGLLGVLDNLGCYNRIP